MLSEHTTPEIDLLRFFEQYHNDSLPPLCLQDNIWGSVLWRHTCIAYSFVSLVFGAQICCQLIILLCIFPERNKQRLLANWGLMPNNQQTYLHVMCVITVLSIPCTPIKYTCLWSMLENTIQDINIIVRTMRPMYTSQQIR